MADTTNQPANVFRGDASHLTAVDIDGPLSASSTATCEYYIEQYGQAARQAADHGDTQSAEVYRFLQVLVGFSPSFDTPSQPFVPMWQMDGKRSLIPSDLSAADIEVLRILASQAADKSLRARLHDVLWELTKDHNAGAEAAACYTAAADKLDLSSDWIFAVTSFKRGLYLASRFGRSKPLFENTANTLIAAAKRAATSVDAFHCLQLMRLMLPARIGEPSEFTEIAASLAADAQKREDMRTAKAYWEAEADWRWLAKDKPGEERARLAAAEAAVTEAEMRAVGKGASFMAAAGLMSSAIEEMRRAGATKERIDGLKKKLNEWQEHSLSEFKTFSVGTDISNAVTEARDHVKGHDFPTAVLRLAFGHNLSDPKKIRDEVLKNARDPFKSLSGGAIVDQRGRVTARRDALLNLKGEALEQALEAEAFSHASHCHWPLRVDAFINPAREQILNEHKPMYQDLLFIVRNNPVIPQGHEGIFLRGLHAGFHGDFVVATHLLTPQIENSMRYVLESHGVDVSNLMSDGTQPVKVLGAIFALPETKQLFGEALCFELRGFLIEKSGFDFRNRVAHGFVHEAECYSTGGVTVWWLVLRMCLMPIFHALAEEKQAPQSGSEGPPSSGQSGEQPTGS